MAFEAAIPEQFALDILNGLHQPSDDYKIALYTQAAATDKNKLSTTYTTTGELPTAGGYTQGGISLTGYATGIAGDKAYIDFDDPVWNPASITADAAVIYNATRASKVVAVIAFSTTTSTNGPFTVVLPPPGPTAVIRIRQP